MAQGPFRSRSAGAHAMTERKVSSERVSGERDIEAIRAKAARLLERMRATPPGPKRKRLASQHVEMTNEALRAEGFNAALALPPVDGLEVVAHAYVVEGE